MKLPEMKFILDQFNLHLYYSLQNYIPKQKSPPPHPLCSTVNVWISYAAAHAASLTQFHTHNYFKWRL